MNTFVVNKTSWHYRWMCFYQSCLDASFRKRDGSAVEFFEDWKRRPSDFCQYWRWVAVWPSIRIGFNLAIYALAGLFLLNASGAGALSVAIIAAVAAVIIIFIVGFAFIGTWFKDKLDGAFEAPSTPPLLKTAYSAWKHKFCPALEYGSEA